MSPAWYIADHLASKRCTESQCLEKHSNIKGDVHMRPDNMRNHHKQMDVEAIMEWRHPRCILFVMCGDVGGGLVVIPILKLIVILSVLNNSGLNL